MKILMVIPSVSEYSGISKTFPHLKSLNHNMYRMFEGRTMVDFLVPGPGIPTMIYYLSKLLVSSRYDLAVLAGICGSYQKCYRPGDVLRVGRDRFGDLGAGSPQGFLTAEEIKLYPPDQVWTAQWMEDHPGPGDRYASRLHSVAAVTVNTVSGTEEAIKQMNKRYSPDIESMEGAAFFYVCRLENLNFVQIRAVSNLVEPRNRANWEIEKAINNLAIEVKRLIDDIHA